MKYAAIITLLCLTVGCGGGSDAEVMFEGSTPITSSQIRDAEGNVVDARHTVTVCPSCRKPVDVNTQYCPDVNNCGVEIAWDKPVPCAWCDASGNCHACFMMEQKDGNCANCEGAGVVAYLGKPMPCPNCKDGEEGKCPVCRGSQKCDMCGGDGQLSADELKKLNERAPKE
jgi:hypothetical protein